MEWVIGGLIFFMVGILLVIPCLILSLGKLALIGILYFRRGTNDEKWTSLKGPDVMFAMNKTGEEVILSNVGFLLKLDGHLEVNQLRERFYNCFLAKETGDRYENLWSWIDTLGGYCFRVSARSRLDLDSHITERKLGECKVEDFVGSWMQEKYKLGKPCWEMVVLKGAEEVFVVMKINHVICDGYSMLHLIDKLTGNKSPYFVKPEELGSRERTKLLLKVPLHMGNPFHPDRVFQPVTTDSRTTWSICFITLPLPVLKKIRCNFNCHMLSLVLSLMAGSLSRYLTEKNATFPDEVSFATSLPWPGHPAMDSANPVLCNHFASSFIRVPVGRMDPVERLNKTEASYKSCISNGINRFGPCVVNKLACLLPSALFGKATRPGQAPGVSVPAGLTTIPAGEGYSLLGVPVSRINAFNFGPNVVVHMGGYTISHDNKMQLTIGTSPGSVIENWEALQRICSVYMVEEMEKLSIAFEGKKQN